MQEALGMVETKGLVAMIEAADAMVKAANATATAAATFASMDNFIRRTARR